MVLCIAFSAGISFFFSRNQDQRIGLGTSTSISYAHDMRDGVRNYLIVIHAYTGCDTASAFAGRGKLGALKLTRSEQCQEMFRDLGQS